MEGEEAMRTILACAWLIIPAAVGAYHFGPGQRQLSLDDAGALLAEADELAASEKWTQAAAKYEAALKRLPSEERRTAQSARLERAKALMQAPDLASAHDELVSLVDELEQDSAAEAHVRAEAQETLASARYYVAWLMRLEGLSRDEWEPQIEAARQTYRLRAEQAASTGDAEAAKRNREDVEAAIRLARMDLRDLQGMNLPKQCQGCCSGNCKGLGKGKGKGVSQNKPKGKSDARGASSGPPPDGGGA